MIDVVLIIHFVGLMMGAGGGLGSTLAMRYAATLSPERVEVIRDLGPHLARLSSLGLVVMIASGVAMILMKYGGAWGAMPALFWVKMAFVTTLTLAVIAIELIYAAVKSGNERVAASLPMIGPVAGLSSLLAVVFATLAFQ